MTRRDLNWFVAGATAMTIWVMVVVRRANREIKERQGNIWRDASVGEIVCDMQEPGTPEPQWRLLSHWSAEVFADHRKRNEDV